MLKGNYYNPIHKKKITIVIKYSYRLIPMTLHEFGECFELDCHKEVMPYDIYTYENVSKGACCIQDAKGVLKTEDDKQQFLDMLKNGIVYQAKGCSM